MAAPPDPRLQLSPMPGGVRLWLFVLVVPLPLLLAAGALALGMRAPPPHALVAGSWLLTWLATLGGTGAVVAVVWLVLALALGRHALALDQGVLTVRSTFYTARATLAELDLERARVVDLDEHTELRPLFKTNGYTLPGFRTGWFRMRDLRQRAFVVDCGSRHLLWLPGRGRSNLLLDVRDPNALLARLRELAGPVPHR